MNEHVVVWCHHEQSSPLPECSFLSLPPNPCLFHPTPSRRFRVLFVHMNQRRYIDFTTLMERGLLNPFQICFPTYVPTTAPSRAEAKCRSVGYSVCKQRGSVWRTVKLNRREPLSSGMLVARNSARSPRADCCLNGEKSVCFGLSGN